MLTFIKQAKLNRTALGKNKKVSPTSRVNANGEKLRNNTQDSYERFA